MADTLATLLTAAGLAGATGSRAGLPLFAAALVKHFQAPIPAAGRAGLVLLAALAIVETLVDKFPQGRLFELALPPVRAFAGGLAFAWLVGGIPVAIAFAAGILLSSGVSLAKSSWRGVAVFVAGPRAEGMASSLEDAVAGFLVALSVLVPVLAFVIVLALATRGFTRLLAESRVKLV